MRASGERSGGRLVSLLAMLLQASGKKMCLTVDGYECKVIGMRVVVVIAIHRRSLKVCGWIHVERRGGDVGALHYCVERAARIEERVIKRLIVAGRGRPGDMKIFSKL